MSADRIILTGMQFYGFHGVNAEERALGQPFVVDLETELDLEPAGASDAQAGLRDVRWHRDGRPGLHADEWYSRLCCGRQDEVGYGRCA